MKRFWKTAAVLHAGDGYEVHLDGRPLRTPARAAVLLPTCALAEAVAAEWDAQGAEISPLAMPLTRASNSAIDRVGPSHAEVAASVAGYGETDLLCYRAPHPRALAERQAEGWDPLLAWAAETFRARLAVAEGVMHIPQDPAVTGALAAAVAAHDAWELTALHDLVTISGSLVLGLAVSSGRLAAADAWRLSRIDEDWNIREWGEDAEAAAQATRREADFATAARLLALVRAR